MDLSVLSLEGKAFKRFMATLLCSCDNVAQRLDLRFQTKKTISFFSVSAMMQLTSTSGG